MLLNSLLRKGRKLSIKNSFSYAVKRLGRHSVRITRTSLRSINERKNERDEKVWTSTTRWVALPFILSERQFQCVPIVFFFVFCFFLFYSLYRSRAIAIGIYKMKPLSGAVCVASSITSGFLNQIGAASLLLYSVVFIIQKDPEHTQNMILRNICVVTVCRPTVCIE